jgi:HPt (histidine-containing phosphotransfer) domain-containing protein
MASPGRSNRGPMPLVAPPARTRARGPADPSDFLQSNNYISNAANFYFGGLTLLVAIAALVYAIRGEMHPGGFFAVLGIVVLNISLSEVAKGRLPPLKIELIRLAISSTLAPLTYVLCAGPLGHWWPVFLVQVIWSSVVFAFMTRSAKYSRLLILHFMTLFTIAHALFVHPARWPEFIVTLTAITMIGLIFAQMMPAIADTIENEHMRRLEVAKRNADLKLVLDSVDQGLAMIRSDGSIGAERSSAFDRLLGAPAEGGSFSAHVAANDPRAGAALELGWQLVLSNVFPVEVALTQLPRRMTCGDSVLTLEFKPVVHEGEFDGALVVITDVTAEANARRDHEAQCEYIAVFERVLHDRDGFASFADEIGSLLAMFCDEAASADAMMRHIHTVKGSAAQWGLTSVARIAHEIETQIVDTGNVPDASQRERLIGAWEAIVSRTKAFLAPSDRVELTRTEIDTLIAEVRVGSSAKATADALENWKDEPAAVRFQRVVDDLAGLASRLGKPMPRVCVEANGVRLPVARFGRFWTSTVHIVRNMMAHGIETPEERVAAGKPREGALTLRATATDGGLTIEFGDDGRGIDWAAVAEKARAAGLPAGTQAELERALLSAGISTAAGVTEIAGRGVGLAAVAERCAALGGEMQILTRTAQGTRFVFAFPLRPMALASSF